MASAQQIDFLLSGSLTDAGDVNAGGKVYTYYAGTTTPKPTWQDANQNVEHTNPVVLDAYGRAKVYAYGSYKLIIKDADDVTIEEVDVAQYVGGANAAEDAAASALWAGSHRTAAEVHANAAQSSEQDAETAQAAAEAAQAAAELAQTGAETAETNAEAAQDAAEDAQEGAENAERSAGAHMSAAASAAARAESSSVTAQGVADSLDLPTLGAGDAGKGLVVNSTEDGYDLGAPPPAMIPLTHWQTDPDVFTVRVQDGANTDGLGVDAFYKYVFEESENDPRMYTQVYVPFEGYDLRLVLSYRMSTAVAGNVYWYLKYRAVSPGDSLPAYDFYTDWNGAQDATDTIVHTPSATADVLSVIDDNSFKIPAAAYSAGDLILISLRRNADSPTDTHTGDAEVADAIILKPVAV